MKVNVYDFDKTIYNGDSTVDFCKFCISKKKSLLLCLPKQGVRALLFKAGVIPKTKFKEGLYAFLQKLDNIDALLDEFWESHRKNIFGWYLDVQDKSDIIISASPQFLLEPIVKRLGGMRLIASVVDKHTGKYSGQNCDGKEKVRRLNKEYPGTEIALFYSDSRSDTPLAELAENSFLIVKGELYPWQ